MRRNFALSDLMLQPEIINAYVCTYLEATRSENTPGPSLVLRGREQTSVSTLIDGKSSMVSLEYVVTGNTATAKRTGR